jgi:predicted GH43/DUF377 family glycosyl hydrolase
MITARKEGKILEKTNRSNENHGVLNPTVINKGDNVHRYFHEVSQEYYSTICSCRLDGSFLVVELWNQPIVIPEMEIEASGMVNPRKVKTEGYYYFSYTGYNGIHSKAALPISDDLVHFSKVGIIAPLVIYDEFRAGSKINRNIYGWWLINYGAEERHNAMENSAYAVTLLELDHLCILNSRFSYALFKPIYACEKRLEVNNIVFPTGTTQLGDTLYIYGTAGNYKAAVKVNLPELIEKNSANLVANNEKIRIR